MLDREYVREQSRRLSGLAFFPSEPEAVGEVSMRSGKRPTRARLSSS